MNNSPIKKQTATRVIAVAVCPTCDEAIEIYDPVDFVYLIDNVSPSYTFSTICGKCHTRLSVTAKITCSISKKVV